MGLSSKFYRYTLCVVLLALLLMPAGGIFGQGPDVSVRIAMRPISGATESSILPDPLTGSVIPAGSAEADRRDLVENLWAGLFRYDVFSGQAVPVLAREWSVSDDGLTWTFTLRDDLPWVSVNSSEVSALRPIVADDVVAAVRRACHAQKPNPQSNAMFVVAGCYAASRIDPLFVSDERVAELVEVFAPDPATLVIRTAFPVAYLPSLLLDPAFRPVPREFLAFTDAWPSMATSGPYAVAEFVVGESISLVRNPFWPDDLPGNVANVLITYTDDPAAAFASGAADFARLDDASTANAVSVRGDTVTMLGFSAERAWVSEIGVRQALAWALDRNALLGGSVDSLGATTVTHPGAIAGADTAYGIGFEPESAQQALANAGYPGCVGVPEIMALAVAPGQEALADAIIGQWSSVLGCAPQLFEVLAVQPETIDDIGRDLIDEEYGDRVHMWLTTYTPDYLDAHAGASDAFHCQFGYLYSGDGCGPVDGLIDWAAATVVDHAERVDVYGRIEARYFGPSGSYPVVPLWVDAIPVGMADNLGGAAMYGPAWWGNWTLD